MSFAGSIDMDWDDSAVAHLRGLWDEGLSAAEIAKRIGGSCTKNAVIGKARRLCLTPRPSPIKGVRHDAAAKLAKQQAVARLRAEGALITAIARDVGLDRSNVARTLTRQKAAPLPELVAPPEPVVTFAGREKRCCWVIGEPRHGGRYCDAVFVGRARDSYCATHAALAYLPPTQVNMRRIPA